jgi:DmsE family decaheme c-type cytochrome
MLLICFPGETSESCTSCHDLLPDSSLHPKPKGDEEECDSCHGPSSAHSEHPDTTAPDTSFGPRWVASTAQQDDRCLACHADDVAERWEDALHMVNDLTCVDCHDLHAGPDKVLKPQTQAGVCTGCHEEQKEGIHAIKTLASENPACTTCHNPHADQRPVGTMRENYSEGCRSCHVPAEMPERDSVSEMAGSEHEVMGQKGRTCLDCHRGIAHEPTDPGAVEPQAGSSP